MHQICVWWPGSARPAGGACSAPPDPLAELKGRELETGGEGREGEMEEEVKVRRKGEDPHCMKCVGAHADLLIIRPKHNVSPLLALWHSMHRSARMSKIDFRFG